ncbi:hypothetical protein RJ639_045206 [Escallonia herrerae]|uniref:Cathepsin propeptide inhibitor domain-containing protein n=1 Tax=Escallonia herrerae TaxID=1293975 RepID=A0AA88W6Q5_9ASTE|nr:hypothetical protein RJ639_045206 [Escallonia herrerae]
MQAAYLKSTYPKEEQFKALTAVAIGIDKGMWVSQTTSRALHDVALKERHEQRMVRYGRVYKDDVEKLRRYKTFNDNVEYIESFSNAGTHTYTLHINEFVDMTKEEFKASRTGYKKSSNPKSSKLASFKYENVTVERP